MLERIKDLLAPDESGWSLWVWNGGTDVFTPYITIHETEAVPEAPDHIARNWTRIAEGSEEYITALRKVLTAEATNEHGEHPWRREEETNNVS